MTEEHIGGMEHLARAFKGNNPDETYGEGVIVGICPVPTYRIRRQDGTEFFWRVDLTEVGEGPLTPGEERYPPRAAVDRHFILYETINQLGAREAVCYCGANFTSANPMYGTIGEVFAMHIRSIRTRERLDAKEKKRRER